MTIFGNPQMALMASKSNAFVDQHSRLELTTCVKYLWLPTFVVWLLNVLCLIFHYRVNRCRTTPKDVPDEIATIEEAPVNRDRSVIARTTTPVLLRYTEYFRLKRLGEGNPRVSPSPSRRRPSMIDRSVSVPSLASFDQSIAETSISFQPSESRLFKSILFILLITVIALLFASSDKLYFDIGM